MRRVVDSHAGLPGLLNDTFDFLDHAAIGLAQHQARYSAIVLGMYAAMEGQIRQTARLCGEHIGGGAVTSFDQLPVVQRVAHVKQSIGLAEGLVRREPSLTNVSGMEDEHELLRPFGRNWWRVSGLFLFGRNIWPDALSEKVTTLGGAPNFSVARSMPADQPFTGSPLETLGWLVGERNQIAHGNTPDNLIEPSILRQLASDLLDVAKAFARELSIAACHLGGAEALQQLGPIAPLEFGSSTLGIESLRANVAVGQEILLLQGDGSTRVRRVQSVQQHGVSLPQAAEGDTQVAISFNRPVGMAVSVLHLA